jgi:hypothetical protein
MYALVKLNASDSLLVELKCLVGGRGEVQIEPHNPSNSRKISKVRDEKSLCIEVVLSVREL